MTDNTETIRIDFTLEPGDDASGIPSPSGLAGALAEGLPKEWFDYEGDFKLVKISPSSKRPLAYLTDRVANLAEKNDNQAAIIDDLTSKVAAYTKSIIAYQEDMRELRSRQIRTVGITDQEAETLREQARLAIDELMSTRLEDLDGSAIAAYDEIYHAIGELPIMEERDLGWGDDEQLTRLENVEAVLHNATTELGSQLDEIRTGRADR